MSMTTLTSHEFHDDIAGAKNAAEKGPVVITEGGKPSHVLLTYECYVALSRGSSDIVDRLGMPEAAQIDMHPPKAVITARHEPLG